MDQRLTINMFAPVVPRLEPNGHVTKIVPELLDRDDIHEILSLWMCTGIDVSIRERLWFLLPANEAIGTGVPKSR